MNELECRKDRFRKATKAYYEEAEREYRRLNGFYCSHTSCHSHERVKEKESTYTEEKERMKMKRTTAAVTPNNNTFKRQRPRAMYAANNKKTININMDMETAAAAAKPVHKPELELDLAHYMLESYYRIVELAIEGYLKTIRNFVLLVRQQLQRQRQRARVQVEVQVQEITGGRHYHNNNDNDNNNNNNWERIQSRLQRHHAEVVEEQHIAMASAMVAVRETKITGKFAKKIHNCLGSVLIALRSVINSNRNGNNIPSVSITINTIQPLPAAAIRKKEQHIMDSDSDHDVNNECAVWDRTVVEALKLDGYYRWFCKNNGVLIGNNKPIEKVE